MVRQQLLWVQHGMAYVLVRAVCQHSNSHSMAAMLSQPAASGWCVHKGCQSQLHLLLYVCRSLLLFCDGQ